MKVPDKLKPHPQAVEQTRQGLRRLRNWVTLANVDDWINPSEIQKGSAWLQSGALFVIGFGLGIVDAVLYLMGHTGITAPTTSWLGFTVEISRTVLMTSGVLVLAAILFWHSGISMRRIGVRLPRSLLELKGDLWMIVATLAFMLGSLMLGSVLGDSSSFPGIEHMPWPEFGAQLTSSITAGPMEEIVVLAFPIVVLRAASVHWAWILPACIAARISYHIYYGWVTSLTLIIWAVGMVLLFASHRRLIAIIVAHSVHDSVVTISAGLDFHKVITTTTRFSILGVWLVFPLCAAIVVTVYLKYAPRRRRASEGCDGNR